LSHHTEIALDLIWEDYQNGSITQRQAQDRGLVAAGSFRLPAHLESASVEEGLRRYGDDEYALPPQAEEVGTYDDSLGDQIMSKVADLSQDLTLVEIVMLGEKGVLGEE